MSGQNLKDATLKLSLALPNGSASASVVVSGIDTGKSTTQGFQSGDIELLLSGPALNTTQLPDTKTMIYDLLTSDNADMSSPVTVAKEVLKQTGAGGAGAAAATQKMRLPDDAKRYVGFQATNSGAGDASGASATLEVVA